MRPVGREDVVEHLETIVERTVEGQGSVVLLEGDPGVGKSFVLDWVRSTASTLGAHVLTAGAQPLMTGLPFGVVSNLFGSAWMELRQSASPESPGALGAEWSVIETAVEELVDRSLSHPLVVVVDDLQWADAPSLRVLAAVAGRAPSTAIAVVGAHRPQATNPALTTLAASVQTRTVPPLAPDAAGALVRSMVGDIGADQVQHLVERSGGNPFWLKQLCRDADPTDGALPRRLSLLLLARLRVLGASALEALTCASILGTQIDVPLLAEILEADRSSLDDSLHQAAELGIVVAAGGEWRFSHDLVREAVLDEVDDGRRLAIRRAAAAVFASRGDDSTAARHLRDLDSIEDVHEGEILLRAASSTALLTLPEASTLALKGWRSLPNDHPLKIETAASVIGFLEFCGRCSEAQDVASEMLDRSLPPAAEASIRVARCAAHDSANEQAQALEAIEPALQLLPDIDPEQRAWVWAWEGRARFWVGDLDAASKAARRADEAGEGRHRLIARQTLALCAAADGEAREAVETLRAVQVERPTLGQVIPELHPDPAGLRTVLASRLIDVDDVDGARREFEAVLDSTDLATPTRTSLCHLGLGACAYMLGDLDTALTEGETALAVVREAGAESDFPTIHGTRAFSALEAGDLDAAIAHTERGWQAALAPGTNVGIEVLVKVDLCIAERSGTEDRSLERVRFLRTFGEHLGYATVWRILTPTAVRVATEVDRAFAEDLTEFACEGARRAAPIASAVAVGDRCRGLLEGDPGLLVAAADAYRRAPRPFEELDTRFEAAAAATEAGDRDLAVEQLRRARTLASDLGLGESEQRARSLLRRLGIRTRRRKAGAASGWPSLTPTEVEVVRRVANGATNRQIGTELIMSPRTVETHLSHVFQKLGLRSRVEVTAAYHEVDGQITS